MFSPIPVLLSRKTVKVRRAPFTEFFSWLFSTVDYQTPSRLSRETVNNFNLFWVNFCYFIWFLSARSRYDDVHDGVLVANRRDWIKWQWISWSSKTKKSIEFELSGCVYEWVWLLLSATVKMAKLNWHQQYIKQRKLVKEGGLFKYIYCRVSKMAELAIRCHQKQQKCLEGRIICLAGAGWAYFGVEGSAEFPTGERHLKITKFSYSEQWDFSSLVLRSS